MTKPPEIILCEVADDEPSPCTITYTCDLETGAIISIAIETQPSKHGRPPVQSISYDANGKLESAGETKEAVFGVRDNFASRQWNVDTALQYNRTTLHDARPGRWMSQDPIAFAGDDANLYRYVHQPKTEGQ
jgi:RHS repeat-associated protein